MPIGHSKGQYFIDILYICQYSWQHICFLYVNYVLELIKMDYGETRKDPEVLSAARHKYCSLNVTSKICGFGCGSDSEVVQMSI